MTPHYPRTEDLGDGWTLWLGTFFNWRHNGFVGVVLKDGKKVRHVYGREDRREKALAVKEAMA